MSGKAVIASRTFLAADPNGREFEITVSVGEPHETEPDIWSCPVAISGMYDELSAKGGDSWQSILFAFGTIKFLLQRFLDKGGKLMWPEDHEPMLLEELFPEPSRK